MSKVYSFLSFLIFSSVIFSACKPTSIPPIHHPDTKLDYKSPNALKDYMLQKELKFEWLSGKFSCDAEFGDKSNSFTVNLRIRKDSVIWMSITGLGIEAARVMITRDSAKVRNNIGKTFFVGDHQYISKMLNAEVDFDLVQSLLVGNSAEFYEEDEKLRSGKESGKYFLSTIRKRKLKRIKERPEMLKELLQVIWLQPDVYKITDLLITDPNTNRSFEAKYSTFTAVDSMLVPYTANFTVKAEKKINIQINYSKININAPQQFPFTIPENYEQKM